MAVSRQDMQKKIDRFLEEETKKALENDAEYQENLKKLDLYCRFFGIEERDDRKSYEDFVLSWNCKYIPIEEINSEYFWELATIGEAQAADHISKAYWAESRVQAWDKYKAKLQAKLDKPRIREKKAEKLRAMIEEGEKSHEIDRKIAAAKNETVAHIKADPNYFTRAAIAIKRAEEAAIKKIIADNTEKEEIGELVLSVLEKRRVNGESRFYRYGKEVVEDQQSKLAQAEAVDKVKESLKAKVAEETQKAEVEEEIEAQ